MYEVELQGQEAFRVSQYNMKSQMASWSFDLFERRCPNPHSQLHYVTGKTKH